MSEPQAVNSAITDAVTQTNVKVLAESPALSLSNLYQTISQSLSLSAQNAVTSQQQTNILHQTTTTQGVSLLYSIDTLSMGVAGAKINRSDTPDSIANLLAVLQAFKNNKPPA
ncbi:MAG: RebB family R body protein [Cyanobacteria bacterium SBLK]|nr:RebB family R body protein [Cyanobacteria bacterium SBLK]